MEKTGFPFSRLRAETPLRRAGTGMTKRNNYDIYGQTLINDAPKDLEITPTLATCASRSGRYTFDYKGAILYSLKPGRKKSLRRKPWQPAKR
jgi:hypothetical protein